MVCAHTLVGSKPSIGQWVIKPLIRAIWVRATSRWMSSSSHSLIRVDGALCLSVAVRYASR